MEKHGLRPQVTSPQNFFRSLISRLPTNSPRTVQPNVSRNIFFSLGKAATKKGIKENLGLVVVDHSDA